MIGLRGLLLVAVMGLPEFVSGQTSRVPFVGCESDGQTGEVEAPEGSDVEVALEPSVAARLAYYESGVAPGVLAPRGWSCFGTFGSSGSNFFVAPEDIGGLGGSQRRWTGPVIQVDHKKSDGSGRSEVAPVIARVFPQFRPFLGDLLELFEGIESELVYAPYPTDILVRKGSHTVEFRTPPNTKGLGTIRDQLHENDMAIDGVVIAEGEVHHLLQLRIRLPEEMQDLVRHIITHFEKEAAEPPR